MPLVLIVIGLGLGSLSLMGIQAVFFGYGFHFQALRAAKRPIGYGFALGLPA